MFIYNPRQIHFRGIKMKYSRKNLIICFSILVAVIATVLFSLLVFHPQSFTPISLDGKVEQVIVRGYDGSELSIDATSQDGKKLISASESVLNHIAPLGVELAMDDSYAEGKLSSTFNVEITFKTNYTFIINPPFFYPKSNILCDKIIIIPGSGMIHFRNPLMYEPSPDPATHHWATYRIPSSSIWYRYMEKLENEMFELTIWN